LHKNLYILMKHLQRNYTVKWFKKFTLSIAISLEIISKIISYYYFTQILSTELHKIVQDCRVI
jgi:hypothetical protein